MNDWENYCAKFEPLLKYNIELTSLRLELYYWQRNSPLKAIVKIVYWLIKLIRSYLRFNKIAPINIETIYFVSAELDPQLGTLKHLFTKDKNSFIIITNERVAKNSLFLNFKKKYPSYNYENSLLFNIKDFNIIFKHTIKIAKELEINYFIVLASVFKYILIRNSINKIIKSIEAKQLVATIDNLLDYNLVIYAAERKNIKNYILQQGALTFEYLPTISSNYIVWGNIAKEWFEIHKAKTNILPLGTPRMDMIYNLMANKEKIKNDFFKKYNLSTTKKVFLFFSHSKATEFGIDVHIKNFEALKEIINNKEYQLVIKFHPTENTTLFNTIFGKLKKNIVILNKDENIYHAILAADICASTFSTTLVESMCLEKPTLQMNFAQIDNLPDYSKSEGCIAVENFHQLREILSKKDFAAEILRQNRYISRYYTNLGCSAEQILNYVYNQEHYKKQTTLLESIS